MLGIHLYNYSQHIILQCDRTFVTAVWYLNISVFCSDCCSVFINNLNIFQYPNVFLVNVWLKQKLQIRK